MSDLTERTCDACGAAARMRDGEPEKYDAWAPENAHIGRVFLCKEHWKVDSEEKLVPLILARRAAQPKEVDPRTLPVGAVFRDADPDAQLRWYVTKPGYCSDRPDGREVRIIIEHAIVISLPPAEVELGSLRKGEWFKFVQEGWGGLWAEGQACYVTGQVTVNGCIVTQRADGSALADDAWLPGRPVIRVPPPTSAGSGKTVPPCESCGCGPATDGLAANGDWLKLNDPLTRLRVCSTCAENPPPKTIDRLQLLRDRIHEDTGSARPAKSVKVDPPCATKDCPNGTLYGSALCTKCRWPGASANNSHVLELEILLAEQVRHGGQDCPAARSLIERADRVRREAEEQQRAMWGRRAQAMALYGDSRTRDEMGSGKPVGSGIASLRLDRPLIAYKRRV